MAILNDYKLKKFKARRGATKKLSNKA